MIVTLNKLLEFNLLSKEESLEILQKLVPLTRHSNTWISEGASRYINYMSDTANKILTSAEVYCLIRPLVKKQKKLAKSNLSKNLPD